MSGIAPPLLLAAAALAGGWWLGSRGQPGQNSAPKNESPAAAVDDAALPPSGFARRAAMLKPLENPSFADIQRFLASGKMRPSELFPWIERWAKEDPAGLWNWLENGGRKKMGFFDVTNVVFAEWFRASPEAAMTAFRRLDRSQQPGAAGGILGLLFTGSEAVRQKLLPLLDELSAVGTAHFFGSSNPADDAAKLAALPASRGRDLLLEQTARTWMEKDFKAATAWAATLKEPEKSKFTEALAAAININSPMVHLQRNGADLAGYLAWEGEWLTHSATPEVRRRLGENYIKMLANIDTTAALAWAQDNLSARALSRAVTETLAHEAVKDPAKAKSAVEQLAPGGLKQRAAFAAAGKPGPEAVQWLMSQVEPGVGGWGMFGANWAFGDPDSFRKFVTAQNIESLPDGMLRAATGNFVRKDPQATLAWAAGIKSADLTGDALKQWSQYDAPAAAAWLKSNPGTVLKDTYVSELTKQYFARSASGAVAWAVSLSPGPLRDSSFEAIKKQMAVLPADVRAPLEATLNKP